MKITRIILPLMALAAVGFAQDVRYNFDKGANFGAFKTFKWVQIKDTPQLNQLVDEQVRTAIEGELAKKGLTKVTSDDANLLIGYQFTLGQEKQINSYSSDFGYGAGWGRGWYGGGMGGSSMTTSSTSTIHVGELALDMYDPAGKQIVWRGTASKTLDAKAKPEKRQKNLDKGVVKLLKNYPPPAK
ncbi:MAG: DUF4136 domain-containing protein [Candidatus Solibacter sp.]